MKKGTFQKDHTIKMAKVIKERYLPFSESRTYVRNLGLKNQKEWKNYCKSGLKFNNIPSNPWSAYKEEWVSLSDWLGSSNISNSKKNFYSYEEAQIVVKKHNIIILKEYEKLAKIDKRLPSRPENTYKGKYKNVGEFLDTGSIHNIHKHNNYWTLERSRVFVQNLHFKNWSEWYRYSHSDKRPSYIPLNPDVTYKKDWISFEDWVGCNYKKIFPSYEEAKKNIQSISFKTIKEFRQYILRSNINIPTNPNIYYKKTGWISWDDFLKINVTRHKIDYIDYKHANKFALTLNIKNKREWAKLYKEGKIPSNIPKCPDKVYKKYEWTSWGEFLGTGFVYGRKIKYLSFKEFKTYSRSLGVNSYLEWIQYWKVHKKPIYVPLYPIRIYPNEWKGFADLFGTVVEFLSFSESKKIARSLECKNSMDWFMFHKEGKIPKNIPYNPSKFYKSDFIGWFDFLGYNPKLSIPERYIDAFLEKYSKYIFHEMKYHFDDCRSEFGRMLEFDCIGTIYFNNIDFAIEYDGRHHKIPPLWWETDAVKAQKEFERTQCHDVKRDNYCKQKIMIMHRISDEVKTKKEIDINLTSFFKSLGCDFID